MTAAHRPRYDPANVPTRLDDALDSIRNPAIRLPWDRARRRDNRPSLEPWTAAARLRALAALGRAMERLA